MASRKNKVPSTDELDEFLQTAYTLVNGMKELLQSNEDLKETVRKQKFAEENIREQKELYEKKIQDLQRQHRKLESESKKKQEIYVNYKQKMFKERDETQTKLTALESQYARSIETETKLKNEVERLETCLSEAKRELDCTREGRSNSPHRTPTGPASANVKKVRKALGEVYSEMDNLQPYIKGSNQVSPSQDENDVDLRAKVKELEEKLRDQNYVIRKHEAEKTAKPAEKNLRTEYEYLVKKAEASESELKLKLKEKERDVEDVQKESAKNLAKMEANNKQLTKQLEALEKELDETRNRLSEQMGTHLTDNNPNIADLSDKNRPTKLGERYTQLYDNPWTEAFETLEKGGTMTDEDIIIVLRDILTNAHVYCKNKANDQMQQISDTFFLPEAKRGGNIDFVRKQLKELRKASVDSTARQNFQAYWSDIQRGSSKEVRLSQKIKPYVEDCFTLCWMMAVQDPPVVLETILKYGDEFDKTLYREYTKSGPKVEYVVWPPMLLHSEGPILAKGIAQGFGAPKTRGSHRKPSGDAGTPVLHIHGSVNNQRPITEVGREKISPGFSEAVPRVNSEHGYERRSPGIRQPAVRGVSGSAQRYRAGSAEDRRRYTGAQFGTCLEYEKPEKYRPSSALSGTGQRPRRESPSERPKYEHLTSSRSSQLQSAIDTRQTSAGKPDKPAVSSRNDCLYSPTTTDMVLFYNYVKGHGVDYAKERLGERVYYACISKHYDFDSKGNC